MTAPWNSAPLTPSTSFAALTSTPTASHSRPAPLIQAAGSPPPATAASPRAQMSSWMLPHTGRRLGVARSMWTCCAVGRPTRAVTVSVTPCAHPADAAKPIGAASATGCNSAPLGDVTAGRAKYLCHLAPTRKWW